MSNPIWIPRILRKLGCVLLLLAGQVFCDIEKLPNIKYPYNKRIDDLNTMSRTRPPLGIVVKARIFGSREIVDGFSVEYKSIKPENLNAYYNEYTITRVGTDASFRVVVGCSRNFEALLDHDDFDETDSIPIGLHQECRVYTRFEGNVRVSRTLMGMPGSVFLILNMDESEIALELSLTYRLFTINQWAWMPRKEFEGIDSETSDLPFDVSSVARSVTAENLKPANVKIVGSYEPGGVRPPTVEITVRYGDTLLLTSTLTCVRPETLAEKEWIYLYQRDKLGCYVISKITDDPRVVNFSTDGSGGRVLVLQFHPTLASNKFVRVMVNIGIDNTKYIALLPKEGGDESVESIESPVDEKQVEVVSDVNPTNSMIEGAGDDNSHNSDEQVEEELGPVSEQEDNTKKLSTTKNIQPPVLTVPVSVEQPIQHKPIPFEKTIERKEQKRTKPHVDQNIEETVTSAEKVQRAVPVRHTKKQPKATTADPKQFDQNPKETITKVDPVKEPVHIRDAASRAAVPGIAVDTDARTPTTPAEKNRIESTTTNGLQETISTTKTHTATNSNGPSSSAQQINSRTESEVTTNIGKATEARAGTVIPNSPSAVKKADTTVATAAATKAGTTMTIYSSLALLVSIALFVEL